MKNGLYMVHILPEVGDYSLSVVVDGKVLQRRVKKQTNGSVIVVDSAKGSREFDSIEDLIVFYKTNGIQLQGDLVMYLTECLPPS